MRWRSAKQEKEAHGEIETEHPGYLGAQDTYYVGTLKGVGRIYQQTFIDTYSKLAMVKLYDRKHAIMAADMLNDRVLPLFEEHEVPLLRILTDRGSEYCGNRETHEYALYLDLENIEGDLHRVHLHAIAWDRPAVAPRHVTALGLNQWFDARRRQDLVNGRQREFRLFEQPELSLDPAGTVAFATQPQNRRPILIRQFSIRAAMRSLLTDWSPCSPCAWYRLAHLRSVGRETPQRKHTSPALPVSRSMRTQRKRRAISRSIGQF